MIFLRHENKLKIAHDILFELFDTERLLLNLEGKTYLVEQCINLLGHELRQLGHGVGMLAADGIEQPVGYPCSSGCLPANSIGAISLPGGLVGHHVLHPVHPIACVPEEHSHMIITLEAVRHGDLEELRADSRRCAAWTSVLHEVWGDTCVARRDR